MHREPMRYEYRTCGSQRGNIYVSFFFSSRRRHTRCSRDWSSDVCSSDLYIATSADIVITARNIHNWAPNATFLEKAMKDFHAVLKPGGVLAVEEHRADPKRSEERRVGKEGRCRWRPACKRTRILYCIRKI